MSAPQSLFPDCPLTMAWRPFRNLMSGEVIPAFAVMSLTSSLATAVIGNQLLVNARRPLDATYGPMSPYFVNYQFQVPAGSDNQGFCSPLRNQQGFVLYDTTNTPGVGQVWGPKDGEWKLYKGYPGFVITGKATTVNSIDVVPAMQVIDWPVYFSSNGSYGGTVASGSYLNLGETVQFTGSNSGGYNAVGIAGRYEYHFFARFTPGSYNGTAYSGGQPDTPTMKSATCTVQATKIATDGTTATVLASCSAIATTFADVTNGTIAVPGIIVLGGQMNLDYGDTVQFKLSAISPSTTASFSDGSYTLRMIGPQRVSQFSQ